MRFFRNFVKFGLYAAAGVGVVVALLLLLVCLDHRRETSLPAPTGPFAVGRTTAVWSDPATPDSMAPQPGAKRELFAWIWYPAATPSPSQPVADYMPDPLRKAMQNGIFVTLLNRDPARVRAHSYRDADISPEQQQYPVVLMRPGLAALTVNYTSLAEDLASHGYVVVGIDAPYRSFAVAFPDGRVIRRAAQNNADLVSGAEQKQLATRLADAWSSDLGFVLDQLQQLNSSDPSGRFRGRLDMQRVGVFGHSLGGATALEFCSHDERCKAGIDVDGLPLGDVVRDGVKQPFMILLSDHSGESDAESGPVMLDIRSIYDRLPANRRLMVTLRGANHFGFSDNIRNQVGMRVMLTVGRMMGAQRQIAITEHFIDSFFDVYLKGAPVSELQGTPYPEVEYER